MSRRGRRGNGQARPAQAAASMGDDEEDSIVPVDESGAEIVDDGPDVQPVDADEGEPDAVPEHEDDEFAVLKRQFDDLKAQKAADEAKIREFQARNSAQVEDHQATQKALLEHALASSKAEITTAKRAFKDAMTAGDFEAASEAQVAISAAQLEARQYELAQDTMERELEATRNKPAQQQQPASREEWINNYMVQFNPATREWAEKNKDVVFKSQASVQQGHALHYAAVAGGITPETPEYFAYMEQGMGIKSEPAKAQRAPQERRPPIASAPVSRGNSGGDRLEVPLTSEQRAMAPRLGMTTKQYAKHLSTIQQNQNDPNWRGPRLSQFDGTPKG